MFYILKHKTKRDRWCYVGISAISNEGREFCNSTCVEFELGVEQPYLFTDKTVVENILSGEYDIRWYDSSVDSPELSHHARKEITENYEIVKLVPEI